MSSIAKQRLASQGFHSAQFERVEDVAAWLGAIQAQDYAGAKWSVGLRLIGSSDVDVEQAIAAETIVRTWALRGTLHFVAAKDVHWLLALLAPRIIAKNARRYRQLELDEQTLARSNQLLAQALEGGRQLDRVALRAVLEEKTISTEGQRIFYMLQRAALDGLICQGTAPRNNPAYLQLAPPTAPKRLMNRDEALAELAARYFSSRGPAMLDDFVWWSGLLVADARTGLAAAKPNLAKETIGGKTYWRSESPPALPDRSPDIYLLPGFDEYLVGYRDRSAAIDAQYAAAWSKSKAMFSPSILLRSQVSGLWKRSIKKQHIEIEADLFKKLTVEENEALEAAAQAYGRFLDKPAQIVRN